ncbi:hypothetical protein MNBD_CHLOROFLEXI01-953 [hydrothermal vent metagenome]|uniref:GmrSD restriction endonucleases N-terminal domain-containing protein n=1 Tax=hydrothermal vent metagenome TaxID=652676 RepID=A0A3B0V3F5_9ZZZZ
MIIENKSKTEEFEEIEATGENDDVELEDYPLDSFLIRTESRTVFEIIRRMESERYILNPDFQREFVWDEIKQSRLIESALMRIPLPVFYLAEQPNGKIVVVDGLQRLTTFFRYRNNDFSLRGIHNKHLIGKRFKDLTPKLQGRLEDTNLTLYLIDANVPERARLDIFERVNSGEPLSRQQMRNSLYMGLGTIWLRKQAKSEKFLAATTGSLNWKKMRDRELINRFCAFRLLGYKQYREKYKGDMDNFLAATLKYMNGLSSVDLENLEKEFQTSMRNNQLVFGRYAFRRHHNQEERRSVINAALFDVWSVVLTRYSEECVGVLKSEIQSLFYDLMDDERFVDMIRIATNSASKVSGRFEIMNDKFSQLEGIC